MTTLPPAMHHRAPVLLHKTQVVEMLHISERTLEKLVQSNRFPRPVRLGKAVFWDEPVVLNWLNRELMPQHAWKPAGQRRAAANRA